MDNLCNRVIRSAFLNFFGVFFRWCHTNEVTPYKQDFFYKTWHISMIG